MKHVSEWRYRLNDAVHALLFPDLDEFKKVNDSSGHAAGDRLLQSVSQVLQTAVRKGDSVARLGGDEFGILLAGCDPDNALLIANTIRESITRFEFNWGEKSFSIGACIGTVMIDRNTQDVNGLMRNADIACYSAKNKGKNAVQVYTANPELAGL